MPIQMLLSICIALISVTSSTAAFGAISLHHIPSHSYSSLNLRTYNAKNSHNNRNTSNQKRSLTSLYALSAKEHRDVSKLEEEFVGMVNEFCEFSDNDIAGVENYRYRALYDGVKASRDEPEVTRAFIVLYEDIVPLRLAGRMIHKHLKSVMIKSKEKQKLVEDNILKSTKLTQDEIYEGRQAFLQLDDDDDGQLSVDDLVQTGIVDTIVHLLGFDSFESLLKKLDEDEDGRLDFEMFMIGLQKCMEDSEVEGCDISTVLDEIVKRMKAAQDSEENSSKDQRKLKYSQRYDAMVAAFSEWEDLVPKGDGRMIEVLSGCFFGAKNSKIVQVRVAFHLNTTYSIC